jgi:hypothetical protein
MKFKLPKKGKTWSVGFSTLLIVISAGLLPVSAAENDAAASSLIKGLEVPKEVQDIIDAYLKDTTDIMSLNKIRNNYQIDPAIKQSDLEAGVPVHEYVLDWNKFMNGADTVPLSTILVPLDAWRVPIRAHEKYLYILDIRKTPGLNYYHQSGLLFGAKDKFERARISWPESSGYIPIYIDCSIGEFWHFPQIDDYNLISLDGYYPYSDSVAAIDKSTGEVKPSYVSPFMKNGKLKKGTLPNGAYLSDSKKVFKIMKKQRLDTEEKIKKIGEMRQKEKGKSDSK